MWTGLSLAHDRFTRLEVVSRGDAGDTRWAWKIA